jgi:hypothetical protein
MAQGTLKVRNACPFPVTFYALAGPSLELAAGEIKSADACLIWFSTRVKGPGGEISPEHIKDYSLNYRAKLESVLIKPTEIPGVSDGEEGSKLGSFLTWFVPEVWDGLSNIFKVKNTQQGDGVFIGAKKEAVYGSSNLIVYATLESGSKPRPDFGKVWYLHLEEDTGQSTTPEDSEPLYTLPDLSSYMDTMIFRVRNDAGYITANRNSGRIEQIPNSEPFNPFEYPSYWTIVPDHSTGNEKKSKILNIFHQQWLTDLSSQNNVVGLYPTNATNYDDQHWIVNEVSVNPEVVTLKNYATNAYLYGNSDTGVGIYAPGYPDQEFTVQTFIFNPAKVPEGARFRIMHVQTGQYLTIADSGDAYMAELYDNTQLFYLVDRDDQKKICNYHYNSWLTYYWNNKQGTCPMDAGQYIDQLDQLWLLEPAPEDSGMLLRNAFGAANGRPDLFYNDAVGFGLYSPEADFTDQTWVI